jgi:DNA mismatch repair protein MutH
MNAVQKPENTDELMQRCYAIAGLTIKEIAANIDKVPEKLIHHKGWFGQLIETVLGADAGSNPTQDFSELGIELKTIPLNDELYPLETTFVCITPLTNVSGMTYENSNVRNKLSRVLWVPFSGSRDIPIPERIVYTPFLWSPNSAQDAALRTDWNEHMEKIATGQIDSITARDGEVLQIRPKAADGKALTQAVGADGTLVMTRPRGFYLRKCFTSEIIRQEYKF